MFSVVSKLIKIDIRFFKSRHKSQFLKHVKQNDKNQQFLSVFPEVVEAVTTSRFFVNNPLMTKHFADVLDYNVLKEKRFRPCIILNAYEILEEEKNLTKENLHLANILAWSMELFQTGYIINDDIMDGSPTRCGDISWHFKDNVKLSAVTDAVFVYEASAMLLEMYFSGRKEYYSLQNLLRYINTSSAIGQAMDWKFNINRNPNFNIFNLKAYNSIVYNKSCVPFVEGPFKAALILSRNYNEVVLSQVLDIIAKLGLMFQIDNDVLDVFDNGNVREKIGSDIEEGKCSWLALQVLENGKKRLVDVFKQNYGKHGLENKNTVVNVYLEMNLFEKYLEQKNNILEFVSKRAINIKSPALKEGVLNLVDNICC